MDGLRPARPTEQGDEAKEPRSVPTLEDQERPEGPSQLDYTLRLAAELMERRHEVQKTGRNLCAIGVLGSDVYDKLLLMQSLRQAMPGALFFTTDMDARLLHSSQQEWARNAIVASSFDLELGEDLQAEVPPFRDSYQTGQFLATLVALGREPVRLLDHVQPRLFEIGRHRPYVLDQLGGENASPEDRKLFAERPFTPPRGRLTGKLVMVLLLLAHGRSGSFDCVSLRRVVAVDGSPTLVFRSFRLATSASRSGWRR